MKVVTDSKYQNTMAWPKSTGQKSLSPPAQDSREAKEDSGHPEGLSCAPALFLPMRWSDSNLDYDFNLK